MTTPADRLPRDLIDRLLRDSLRHPAHLRSFLRQAVPQLAEGFDCDRAQLLERSFQTEDWREREADLPFEIPYQSGGEEVRALVCVLIEHQSDTDPMLPLRLLTFATLYWDRQWRAWQNLPAPRRPLRLSPVLPIVFYTGPIPWGSNRRLTDLLGEPLAFHAFAPQWEPLFWNLADRDAETLLSTGEEWLQLLGLLRSVRDDNHHVETVLSEGVRRLQELAARDKARYDELLRMMLTVVMHYRPRAEHAKLFQIAVDGQATLARQEEVRTMEQTIAEYLVEKGWNQGQFEATRKFLRMVLENKFGALSDSLVARINAVSALDQMEQLVQQALDLKKLEDLSL